MRLTKLTKLLILSIFVLISCNQSSSDLSEIDCQEVFYEELNSGTFTNVITIGPLGDQITRFYGKYECTDDGKLKRISGGNIRKWKGHGWQKIN